LLGRRFWELMHPDDHERTLLARNVIRKGKRDREFENRYIRKDGSVVPMIWTTNWSPTHRMTFCVARDNTIRKRLESEFTRATEAAEAANRAKGHFLANVSHEIRTPLNGIIGVTELVLETQLDHQQREYLGMVKTSGAALLGLINDILDFSKIEAGKLELEAISFNLRECLATALKPLGVRADQKGLELVADLSADVPEQLVGDPLRLRQILINLTDNAIKFTARGHVLVRVAVEPSADDDSWLHFSVVDTGIGIPAEKQAVIFGAFAQADGSTTRDYGGTGLGLAIASELVRKMSGNIWVESSPGHGTTFHFTARIPRGRPAPAHAKQADLDHLKGRRVLIVDDHAETRHALSEMLLQWGLKPTAVGSGAEAIDELFRAAWASTPYSLMLLDGVMPEMDGLTLAEKIQGCPELTGAIILMLSSAMPSGTAARCEQLGVAGLVTKPVAYADLLEAILLPLPGPGIAPAVATAPPPPAPPSGLRILVAEDNVINRALLTGVLEKQGHSLVHAVNGREATDAVTRESFDLVIMDLQMPEMDGFAATRLIRLWDENMGRHTAIVGMTAHAMAGDMERCLAAGMDDYLSKPLEKATLLALLEHYAGEQKSGTDLPVTRAADLTIPPKISSREKLLEQLEGDEAMLRRMVVLFRQNTPRLLGDIREAIARHDTDGIGRAAHALLSSLAALGAQETHRLTRQLGAQASEGGEEDIHETFAAIERGVAEIQVNLAAYAPDSGEPSAVPA
jgi:two-component system sensor histidine kinase/response regulator